MADNKILDSVGLAHLITKIKAYVDEKIAAIVDGNEVKY